MLNGAADGVRGHLADRAFGALSGAADHGLLWVGLSGALTATGRRRRRAAGRGLVALAVTSAVVNGPLKLLFRRRRPARPEDEPRRQLVRQPRTSSFPSGHAASAFAYSSAAAIEAPELLAPLGLLAIAVAHSRLHTRVHHRGDVVTGAAVGVGLALATRVVIAEAGSARQRGQVASAARGGHIPGTAVLVTSPRAGGNGKLARARVALGIAGIDVVAEVEVHDVHRLREVIGECAETPPLVIAAGGDGTVGAVADQLAGSDIVLGVLPLGTSNDFARSLGIHTRVERAVDLLRTGKVSSVDLGRVIGEDGHPRHFAHAATVGLNVNFAKLATRASLRRRLGRLTYTVAAAAALRHREPFDCVLTLDGNAESHRLTQLSVINAPVFGGFLGLRVAGSSADDRLLDVLAVEVVPLHRIILAGVYAVARIQRPLAGIQPHHVRELRVHSDTPLELTLDGEVSGRLPANFVVAGEALRVVTPLHFEDIDGNGH